MSIGSPPLVILLLYFSFSFPTSDPVLLWSLFVPLLLVSSLSLSISFIHLSRAIFFPSPSQSFFPKMASSHHHHQQTHHTQQFNHCNCTSCCTPCCNSTSCNSLPPPPPPPIAPSNPSDQLLQALATTLLLQSQPLPQPHPYPHSNPQFQTLNLSSIPPIPPPVPFFYSPEHLASNQYQCTFPHKPHQPPSHKSNEPLASLFDRVAALESSLFSNPNAKPNPVPPQKSTCRTNHETFPKTYSSSRPASLKDLAARTIQVHFRRYLVRRSQILRDLKRLAGMKCHVAALRSAVSHRAEIDPKKVSDQAADLLLQLDFIRVS